MEPYSPTPPLKVTLIILRGSGRLTILELSKRENWAVIDKTLEKMAASLHNHRKEERARGGQGINIQLKWKPHLFINIMNFGE